MSREPWNGQPVKKGNWGTWAQIETPPAINQSCYTCIHSDENACILLNTVISEIGKGYYKQCEHYVFDDFNDIGISRKRRKQTENSIDRSDYILPEGQRHSDRQKIMCIRYAKKNQICIFFQDKCIGANICKMFLSESMQYLQKQAKEKKENISMEKVLSIKRTLQNDFGADMQTLIEAYMQVLHVWEDIENTIKTEIHAATDSGDFDKIIRIATEYKPFLTKVNIETDRIKRMIDDLK